jgi:hypothetical protein
METTWPHQRNRGRHNAVTGLLVIGVVVLSACTSIGPQRLESDNTAYNDALGEAWKQQMLLNMVKLRYGDAPVFINVASLINQYSFEGQVSLNSPGWDRPNNVGPPVGGVAGRPDAVAMLTRSLLEIIGEFSFGVEVPQQHLEQGRCRPAPRFEAEWEPPSVTIRSGGDAPGDAFVAVRYRDLWFWIDDTDFPSKRRFSFLLLLTSLAETGSSPAAPLITVGTGG